MFFGPRSNGSNLTFEPLFRFNGVVGYVNGKGGDGVEYTMHGLELQGMVLATEQIPQLNKSLIKLIKSLIQLI